MSLLDFTLPVILHSNMVSPTYVSQINTTGITATESGFPASNLKYADPYTLMRTNGVGSSITIEHEFASSQLFEGVGILNHNMGSASWTSIAAKRWNGSTYDLLGTLIFYGRDFDQMMFWDMTGVTTSTKWLLQIDGAGDDFYLGSVFWGSKHEMDKSPANAAVIQRLTTPVVTEVSAGGARHVSFGAEKRHATLELTWERATMPDVLFMATRPVNELMGVLTTEMGDVGSLGAFYGGEPFFGYMSDRTQAPVGPGQMASAGGVQQATYQLTLYLEGAT